MTLEIFHHRRPLKHTLEAIKNGELTIGFIGGSITDPRGKNRWPEPVIAWFVKNFPNVRITVENAAIGATGSDLAALRVEKDLLCRNCDLIFIEYAVNDNEQPAEKRFRTREGLIRKVLSYKKKSDVVFVYTYSSPMYEDMMNDSVPESVKDFEILARHYDIGSVWMGLYALNAVREGQIRWEEWVPDGLHPDTRGSYCYGESVRKFLSDELLNKNIDDIPDTSYVMPAPYNKNNWENTYLLPFSDVKLDGPWTIRRCSTFQWIDKVLDTSAIGAKLSFTFEGRGLALGFDFGKLSADFKYRVDGGKWIDSDWDRPDWIGDDGWYRLLVVSDELKNDKHSFELEVTHQLKDKHMGTIMRLALIGIIK